MSDTSGHRLRLRVLYVSVGAAAIAFALGYAGYARLHDPDLSASDQAFSTLQLFSLNESVPAEGTPWELDVARFLAPAALLYAAVATVLALLRNQLIATRVRRSAAKHVVLIASSATALPMAEGLADAGHDVVVLEATGKPLPDSARRDVRCLSGDPSRPRALASARIDRAAHVLVLSDDDTLNLEIAALASHLAREAVIHVEIDHQDLWRELSRSPLDARGGWGRVQYVNTSDTVAQLLLDRAEATCGGPITRAVVDGSNTTAVRLLVHLIRRAHLAGCRPEITLTHREGPEALHNLGSHEPWCLDVAEVRVESPQQPRSKPEAADPLAVFVCSSSDTADAFGRGVVLARQIGEQARVFAAVGGQWSQRTIRPDTGPVSRVELVGLSHSQRGVWVLEFSALEVIAKARHDDYVAQARARGETSETNHSVKAWTELPASLQQSNRSFALAVSDVVEQLGASIVPLADHAVVEPLPLDEATMDRLARAEHDRWMSDLQKDGWTATTGPKDPELKRHPLLVPWEELSDAERQKDIDGLRAIPQMLARAGYRLELATP